MHADFNKILGQFKSQFGDKEGMARFEAWIAKRSLDTSKAYTPDQLCNGKKQKEALCKGCNGICRSCLKESFEWAKPLIKLLEQDKTGKSYKVEAHFAVTSMNGNVYTEEELKQAVSTLAGKTGDLNHNSDWMMPGVKALACAWEDGCVEMVMHVDNGTVDAKGRDVQETLDSGVIDCVSIEGDCEHLVTTSEGNRPEGFYYTGFALLDQEALPGVPLTRIQPLEELMESIFKEVTVQGYSEVKNKMKESLNEKKLEEMNSKEIEDEIAKLSKDLSDIDAKLYPPYKAEAPSNQPSEEERSTLRAERDVASSKLDAYRQALTQKTLAQATAEAKASFCPMCGSKLVDGKCANEKCKAFGASVQMQAEQLAAFNRKIADLTSDLTAKTKEAENSRAEAQRAREELITASDRLGKATKENLQISVQDTQISALKADLVESKSEAGKLRGKVEGYAENIRKLEAEVNKEHAENQRLQENLGKKETELERVRRELNQESERRAVAEQKALNETKECSRVKQENADILSGKASDVRSISDLSEKLSVAAKEKLTLENENKSLKEDLKKREETIVDGKKTIEAALKEQKRVYKILNEAGIFEVDSNTGNLITPPA